MSQLLLYSQRRHTDNEQHIPVCTSCQGHRKSKRVGLVRPKADEPAEGRALFLSGARLRIEEALEACERRLDLDRQ